MPAQVRPAPEPRASHKHGTAGLVVGTKRAAPPWSAAAVRVAYQGPAPAEGGVRFRTDPRFLVSSWCVNTPCRMHGRLLVMTCARLVYAVTPRRLRHHWARRGETRPNQIHQPTARPTVRWLFQRLDGMHRLRVTVHGKGYDLSEGLNEIQSTILRVFGAAVCQRYHIAPG
jgi:hypothetical protein